MVGAGFKPKKCGSRSHITNQSIILSNYFITYKRLSLSQVSWVWLFLIHMSTHGWAEPLEHSSHSKRIFTWTKKLREDANLDICSLIKSILISGEQNQNKSSQIWKTRAMNCFYSKFNKRLSWNAFWNVDGDFKQK